LFDKLNQQSISYFIINTIHNGHTFNIIYQPKPGKNVDPLTIVAGGETLCSVDNFVYLGSNLSSKTDLGRGIDRRLQAASISYSKLRQRVFDNSNLQISTKLKVYKAVIIPTLLYAFETWAT